MLEQAIVDAAALREAALKNAEQAIIEKYAPQIKEAVNSLLDKDVIQEEVAGVATSEPEPTSIEAPFAASPMSDPNKEVELSITDDQQTWEFDLEQIKAEMKQEGPPGEDEFTGTDELATELGTGVEPEPPEGGDLGLDLGGDELALQEILNLIDQDGQVLEEELIVDMGEAKSGHFETNREMLEYQQEMELAKMESTKYKEENEELNKKIKELNESLQISKKQNEKVMQIVGKLDTSLKETLLSNAKLIYCNKTLSDASLNERQKEKIVEVIAKAKTPEEAKNLHETLKTTVGSSRDSGPKSLRESVSRRSNLSGIMPRRKQPDQEFSFAQHMKKLAGIKT